MYGSEFYKQFEEIMLGGPILALIGAILVLMIFIIIGIYIYWALAWSTILKKLKYKNPWLAWIPIAQIAPILEEGGFHWAWIFLILIPILGWIALCVLVIISTWKVFEKRKYPGWFSLSIIIPQVGAILYLIAIGFVAWRDKSKKKR